MNAGYKSRCDAIIIAPPHNQAKETKEEKQGDGREK